MWWEAPELMIQESWDVKINTDKVDADVPAAEAVNNDIWATKEVLSWETNQQNTSISSVDKWPSDSGTGGVAASSEVVELPSAYWVDYL